MCRKILLIFALSFPFIMEIKSSTIRNSLVDHLNNGLKILGKSDQKMSSSIQSNYIRSPPGISNNVADLVSQSFAPTKFNKHPNGIRQDTILIGPPDHGEEEFQFLTEGSFMSRFLKVLGLDGSKLSAVAMNGIIFMAQMVRESASNVMSFLLSTSWEWQRIINLIKNKFTEDKYTPHVKIPQLNKPSYLPSCRFGMTPCVE
ncbi:CLUMA_CG010385, isoform A [Clunio marinus]|uniref:CLUMA_CG010385, isoform A n=1 Tax=Clunio marinus TaxID=568069 RepID=A0A1J1I9H0_9DIPT|nr:CLUMA_CG010385, isoform A [Clunio marinus]